MKFSNLLISRFLFYTLLLWQIDPTYFLNFSTFPEALWMPTGIFSLMESPLQMSGAIIQGLSLIWYVSGALSALNISFKISSVIFAAVNLLVFNVAHNYGYQTHAFMALVLGAILLAVGRDNGPRLIRILFCAIFLSAGISKLRNGGLDWIFSESLQNILIRSQIFYSDVHPWASSFNLNLWLAQNRVICSIIAGFIVLLELAAPLALLGRRYAMLIVGAIFLMQVGIYFTILVKFTLFLGIYVFWIDWESLYKTLKKPFTKTYHPS